MRLLAFIIGALLMLAGVSVSAYLSWTNPDMTNRRLWMEFTAPLVGSMVMVIIGIVMVKLSVKD